MRKLIVLIAACFMLTSCGFKLRSSADLPPQLHTLSISTPNPDSPFRNELASMLTSLHIHLVKPGQTAPLHLNVSIYSFTHNYPQLTSADTTINYTYSLRVSISIVDKHDKTIVPTHTFMVSQVITQTASSSYLVMGPPNIEPEMTQNVLSQIYYWLISSQTKDALKNKV